MMRTIEQDAIPRKQTAGHGVVLVVGSMGTEKVGKYQFSNTLWQ